MTDSNDLIEVLVTDKNGKVSKRRKKRENIKPTDIIVGAEKAAEPTPNKTSKPAVKVVPKATAKPKPKPRVKAAPVIELPKFQFTPEPVVVLTREQIIANSKLGKKVLRSALQFVPHDRLIDYVVSPTSVELKICNLFGYESRIAIDFIYNIEVEGDSARLTFDEAPMFYATDKRDLGVILPAPSTMRKVAPLVRGWVELSGVS